jgi:glycerol-3-phosphate dehydrogenase (NAD(P)+)
MRRLGIAMGGSTDTFFGLSGIGDLALTCNSMLSRNFELGFCLGKKIKTDQNKTVEGLLTADAACALGKKYNIELPVIETTSLILKNKISIRAAMDTLLSRPLKPE